MHISLIFLTNNFSRSAFGKENLKPLLLKEPSFSVGRGILVKVKAKKKIPFA